MWYNISTIVVTLNAVIHLAAIEGSVVCVCLHGCFLLDRYKASTIYCERVYGFVLGIVVIRTVCSVVWLLCT